MLGFFGTYTETISPAHRILVPATFRKVLEKGGQMHAFIYPSLWRRCLEGCRIDRIEAFARQAAAKGNKGDSVLLGVILNAGRLLKFDSCGRVPLPNEFLVIAGLESEALIVGCGRTFEIWQPAAFKHNKGSGRATREP